MKNINLVFIMYFLIFCIGCDDKTVGDEEIIEPTLEIINPVNGSSVNGDITIQAIYTGDNELNSVTYYVNSSILDEKFSDVLSCQWNTTEWTNGSFDLHAYGNMANNEQVVSEVVNGTIYNEIPEDAELIFDTSVWFPDYRGYKYNIDHTYNVCGGDNNDVYCSLIFSVQVKNIGGLTANNVIVNVSVVVDNVINGYPTSGTSGFGGYTNIGTVQPGESEYGGLVTQYSCNYGPGNSYGTPSCFENITLDDVVIQVTWD